MNLEYSIFSLKRFYLLSHQSLPLLYLGGLLEAESRARLVEGHVGVERHPGLVPQSEHEEPALHTADGRLSYQLVQTLGIQLSPDLT